MTNARTVPAKVVNHADSHLNQNRTRQQGRTCAGALIGLAERTITEFSHGVTLMAAKRTDTPWQALQFDIADDRLIWTIDYSSLLVQSEWVERLAHAWIELFDKLDPHDAIAPDGDIIVSYRRSLPEMLAAR